MTNDLKANYKPAYEKRAYQNGKFDMNALRNERIKQSIRRHIKVEDIF